MWKSLAKNYSRLKHRIHCPSPVCNELFSDNFQLKDHIKRWHDGPEKVYQFFGYQNEAVEKISQHIPTIGSPEVEAPKRKKRDIDDEERPITMADSHGSQALYGSAEPNEEAPATSSAPGPSVGTSKDSPAASKLSSSVQPKKEVRVLLHCGDIWVTSRDVKYLKDGKYLNDTIIDFYLEYLFNGLPADQLRRVHIFKTQFWMKLTDTGKILPIQNLKPSDKTAMHSRVHAWTKHVDLFEKDFIVIPLYEGYHWYLAIVCYPYLDKPVYNDGNGTQSTSDFGQIASTSVAAKPAIKRPCIILLDSLRQQEAIEKSAQLIRYYLAMEWASKNPNRSEHAFNCTEIPDCYPKAPKQTNLYDCGLFLLEYVERFLYNGQKDDVSENAIRPVGDEFLKIMQYDDRLKFEMWFDANRVNNKRNELKKLIKKLSSQWKLENSVGDMQSKMETSEKNVDDDIAIIGRYSRKRKFKQ